MSGRTLKMLKALRALFCKTRLLKLHKDRQPGQKEFTAQNRRLNSTIIHHLKTWAYVAMRWIGFIFQLWAACPPNYSQPSNPASHGAQGTLHNLQQEHLQKMMGDSAKTQEKAEKAKIRGHRSLRIFCDRWLPWPIPSRFMMIHVDSIDIYKRHIRKESIEI